MAKFKVLRPVEYSGKLYLPEAARDHLISRSAGNGQEVLADTTGVIELSQSQAANFTLGQIELITAKVIGDQEQGTAKKKP